MRYAGPAAFRQALEARIDDESQATGVAHDRLRRRVVFQRFAHRLEANQPGVWVVKGGMAMEMRLRDRARTTKDIDLGLRLDLAGAALQEQLVDALDSSGADDGFEFFVAPAVRLADDAGGVPTWRLTVGAELAGRTFARVHVDVSPRSAELSPIERLELANSLSFAGVETAVIDVIDIHRHAAEKFHAMTRSYGDRESTRVKDLVDLMLMVEHQLLDPLKLSALLIEVWQHRDGTVPPSHLATLPATWQPTYEQAAADFDVHPASFQEASGVAAALWTSATSQEPDRGPHQS